MKKRLKINGIIMFLAFIAVVFSPAIFVRKTERTINFWDQFSEILGVSFILLGQLFRVCARGFKAENSRVGNALVETGPYSLVRNPMYLGIFLIGLGIVLMLFKLWVMAVFLTVFVIRYIFLIFTEENKLRKAFPQVYASYCKKVPNRVLPSLKNILDKDAAEYLPLKISWIKKEIGSIVAVLMLTLLVESWEDIKIRGIIAYSKESIGIVAVIAVFIFFVKYLVNRTNKPLK